MAERGFTEHFGVECAHCAWRSYGPMETVEATAEAHVLDNWHVVLMRFQGTLAGGWTPHASMASVFVGSKLELARLIMGNDDRFYAENKETSEVLDFDLV